MTDPVRKEAERLISRYEHAEGVSVSLMGSPEKTYVLLIVGVKPSVQELVVGAQRELEKLMIATLASAKGGGVN
jgi:hypothetical protein